ncbi:hypothetical protein V6N11_028593 [Hibiscus sabdariffa]|uniref:Uncharacterized protein n=1 Tax=Hibiscus sabdariffa TaxID=183260 RepID=A0ABR2NA35_9ROSI
MKIYSSGKHHAGGKDQAQRKITISGIGIAEDLYFVIQIKIVNILFHGVVSTFGGGSPEIETWLHPEYVSRRLFEWCSNSIVASQPCSSIIRKLIELKESLKNEILVLKATHGVEVTEKVKATIYATSAFMIEGMKKSRDDAILSYQLACGPFDVIDMDFNALSKVTIYFEVRNLSGLCGNPLLQSIKIL